MTKMQKVITKLGFSVIIVILASIIGVIIADPITDRIILKPNSTPINSSYIEKDNKTVTQNNKISEHNENINKRNNEITTFDTKLSEWENNDGNLAVIQDNVMKFIPIESYKFERLEYHLKSKQFESGSKIGGTYLFIDSKYYSINPKDLIEKGITNKDSIDVDCINNNTVSLSNIDLSDLTLKEDIIVSLIYILKYPLIVIMSVITAGFAICLMTCI